jgi:hypothetical protein
MRKKIVGILFALVLVASLGLVLVPQTEAGAATNSQQFTERGTFVVPARVTNITMNGDYSITATFEELPPVQYYLAISSTEGGSVTEPGEGVFAYSGGTVVYLVATPDVGYRFDRWTGDVGTIGDIETVATAITMNDNYSITAEFMAVGWSSIPELIAPEECFIATAAYSTPMAEEIQVLREFRDEYLLTNPVGRILVGLYYKVSPPIAEFITEHPSLKPIVRAGLLPAVTISTIAVNATMPGKAVIVCLLALVSMVAVATWAMRRPRCRY